jgi:predicted acetyltransferase
LDKIAADPSAFVAALDDPDAKGGPITLPDGSTVARLPGFHRWLWDGAFCGRISIRWQAGTPTLPPHVLGHVGYGVVPWKRGHGHAKRALALMLIEAERNGLRFIQVTTDLDNTASQRVIRANGGRLVISQTCRARRKRNTTISYRPEERVSSHDAEDHADGCANAGDVEGNRRPTDGVQPQPRA